MTESPINLDEARSIIAVSKSRHADGKGTTTDIDYRYLESIVNELVASRKRIAELERKIESTRKAQLQEVIDNDHAIIPQADDAIILKRLLKISEEEMKDERVVIFLEDLKKEREMYARYLAAIEGGKP